VDHSKVEAVKERLRHSAQVGESRYPNAAALDRDALEAIEELDDCIRELKRLLDSIVAQRDQLVREVSGLRAELVNKTRLSGL
jgi:uncharacterized coiled-coil DUF342 family protein